MTRSSARSKRSSLRCCAARGRRPAAAGWPPISRASATNCAKLRSGETSSLHRAEPRARLSDHELDRAQALIAALCNGARAAGKSRRLTTRTISPNSRSAIAKSLMELSRDEHGVASAFEGPDGLGARVRVRRSARRARADRPDGRARRLCRSVPGRLCRPPGAAAGTAGRATPHLRPAGSAADAIRPRHPGRAGRRRVAAGAARRSLAEPADAA